MNRRRFGVMSLTAACFFWSSLASGTPPADRDTSIKKIRERDAKILDISGQYDRLQTITDGYASAISQATKTTTKQVLDRYQLRVLIRFAMRRSAGARERLMETETFGRDEKQQSHRMIGFDGTKSYLIHNIPKPEQRSASQVTLGVDVDSVFDSDCDFAIMMGLCLPGLEGSVADCIRSLDGAISDVTLKGGRPGVQVVLTRPEGPGKHAVRYTVCCDPNQGFAIRSILQEFLAPETHNWGPSMLWETREWKQDAKEGLWYPSEAERSEFSPGGDLLVASKITLADLKFNQRLTPGEFKPSIEDGSNVFDEKTKTGYVSGRKPSSRIMGFLKKSAEEGRQQAEQINQGPTRLVPMIGGDYGWLLVAGGLTTIVTVGVWQWRSRRSDS
jgi:hypothetical protein